MIVFGEQAVVDQPLSARPAVDRPKAQVERARHEHLPGDPAGPGHAAAGPGQPHRHADRRPPERRQRAGRAPRRPRTPGADLYYVAAPLTFTQEVVAESMVLPQEVKFGEPFQAKVVAWSHKETQGPRLALPQRRVPRLAGRAAAAPARTCSATASRSTRAASTSTRRRSRSTATPSRTTTARWAPSWSAAGRRCCWPTRTEAHAQSLAGRAALAEHRRHRGGAGGDPEGHGGPAEVRRRRPLQRLVAQADPAADGADPRLRPRLRRRPR